MKTKEIPNSNTEFNEFNIKFFDQLSQIIGQLTGHTPLGIVEVKPILEQFLTPYSLNDLGVSLRETIEIALGLSANPIHLPSDFITWFKDKPDKTTPQKPTYLILSKENLKQIYSQYDSILKALSEDHKKYKGQKIFPDVEYRKTCLRITYKTEVIVDIKLPRFNNKDTDGSFYFTCNFFPTLSTKKLLLQQFKSLVFKPMELNQASFKKTFFLNSEDLIISLKELYPLLNKVDFYE